MTAENTLTPEIADKIKQDMIYGYHDNEGKKTYPKLTDAANWYKVSYQSLKKKAGKWKWKQKREDHIAKVNRKVAEKKKSEELSESEAEEIVVNDAKFNDAANLLRRATVQEIQNIMDGTADFKGGIGYQLMNCGRALESAQKISKTAAGEPSDIQKVQGQIDTEHRYKHTIEMIGSDEFREQELGVLVAISEKQELKDKS